MAQDLGTLITRFGADTGELDRAIERSESKMSRYGRKGRSTINMIGKIGAAATAAGAAIAGRLVSQQLRAVETTSRLARSLDISTESASAYGKAFRDMGLETEDVSDALNTLADRAQDAADGTQSMVEDFGLVGISVDDLRGKRPDELFETMARAVAQTEDPTRRAASVVRIFGDDLGRKLLPLLMEGPQAMKNYRKEVDALGLSFSRIEGAQVEQANRSLREVGEAVSGVRRQLAVKLAPIIRGLAGYFTDAAKEAGGLGAVIDRAISGAVSVIGVFADGVRGLRIGFMGLKVVATGFAAAFWTAIDGLSGGIARLINSINKAANVAIRAFNKIPGLVDIDPVAMIDVEAFTERTGSIRDIAIENLRDAKQGMHDLAMEELPSTAFKRWVEEAKVASEEVAAAQQRARDALATGTSRTGQQGGDGEGGDGETEAEKKKTKARRERMQKELDALAARLQGERAMENNHYKMQLERLKTFKQNELLTEQEFDVLKEEAKAKHEKRLTEIQRREQSKRDQFMSKSFDQQVGIVAGSLQQMTSSVGKENKKMFKLTQAAAIANAIVSAYQGISKTLATYPFPLSVAMAAAQGIAAFAQVRAIKSQSFSGSSGGGGGGAGASSGGGAAGSARAAAGGGGQEVRRTANINVSGDSFGGETITRLAEELGDFMSDGGRLGSVNVNRS